jgi:tetratricopeptide (TPR) repeat protein
MSSTASLSAPASTPTDRAEEALAHGQLAQAIAALDAAPHASGREGLLVRARVLLKHPDVKGAAAAALAALEQATRLPAGGPGEVEAWHLRALALTQLGRREEALVAWRAALRAPHDPAFTDVAVKARAAALDVLSRPRERLETYELALQRQPHRVDYWVEKGLSLDELGHVEAAASAFDRALELEPEQPTARYHRAASHAALGRRQAALLDLGRALAQSPSALFLARSDPRFTSLHQDQGFRALVPVLGHEPSSETAGASELDSAAVAPRTSKPGRTAKKPEPKAPPAKKPEPKAPAAKKAEPKKPEPKKSAKPAAKPAAAKPAAAKKPAAKPAAAAKKPAAKKPAPKSKKA